MTETHAAANLVDTSDMPMVHSMFRREFGLAPGLVHLVPAGAVGRAATVADHLELMLGILHHHHEGEDRLLWPLLAARVPEELAPIVELMETQHEGIAEVLQQVEEVLPRWRRRAEIEDRDELHALLVETHRRLVEHLDAEEEHLLPIAARTVSEAEWARLGEEGKAGTPSDQMSLMLGMIGYSADPAVFARLTAEIPAPVRPFVLWRSRRAFRQHSRRVHGTVAPPR